MFTMRFEKHVGRGHKMITCDCYEVVRHDKEGGGEHNAPFAKIYFNWRHPGGQGEDQIFNDQMIVHDIGPKAPFAACYVMNEAGQTVDTIR